MVTSTTDTTKKKTTTEDPAQTSQNTATQDQANSSAQQNAVGGSTAQTNTTVRPSDGVSGTVVGGQQKVETPAPAPVTAPTAENKNYITADYINNFYKQMQDQSAAMNQYTVDKAVQELQRAQEDAQAGFRQQQNQVNVDEAQARDAHVLYAAARGDRGGITARQYDSIANTAAKNRQGIQTAQQKLATDTARQIADLRAQGEFEQANNVLQIAQQQLAHLWQLQQEEADNAARDKQFALQEANLTGKYNGEKTYAAQEAERSWAYDIAMQSIKMGILPDADLLGAAGINADQAKTMAYIYAQTTGNQQFLDRYNMQNGNLGGALGGWLGGIFGGGTGLGGGSSSGVRVKGAGHGSGGSSSVSFDPNVDYQALIDAAVAKGDTAAAAKYEQQRNAKIDAMNAAGTNTGGYTKTNTYNKSSGSGSGNKNNVTFDVKADYQALIDEAVAKGDFAAAAGYEAQRNAKIDALNKAGLNSAGLTKTDSFNDVVGANGVKFSYNEDYQSLMDAALARGDLKAAAEYEAQRNAKVDALTAAGVNANNYLPTNFLTGDGSLRDPGGTPTPQPYSGPYYDQPVVEEVVEDEGFVNPTKPENPSLSDEQLDILVKNFKESLSSKTNASGNIINANIYNYMTDRYYMTDEQVKSLQRTMQMSDSDLFWDGYYKK